MQYDSENIYIDMMNMTAPMTAPLLYSIYMCLNSLMHVRNQANLHLHFPSPVVVRRESDLSPSLSRYAETPLIYI